MTTATKSSVKTDKLKETSVILNSLVELEAHLISNKNYKSIKIEQPEEGMISLTKHNLVQIILGPSIWQSFEKRLPYLKSASEVGICIICIGAADDFAEFPEELLRPEIQTLQFPLSEVGFHTSFKNIHNLHTLLTQSTFINEEMNETNDNIKNIISISRVLNGERDIPKLLNLILSKARKICNADAGSIYTVYSPTSDIKDGKISFRFTQNDSIEQSLDTFSIPVNANSVVGNVVLSKNSINIPDLYKLDANPKNNPYNLSHDRSWDEKIGYQSRSMLTVPLFDISQNIIGVIQLINCRNPNLNSIELNKNFDDQIIPFDEVDQETAEIVAQQAGIALENANFQEEIQVLFNGFVNASVTAIEQRDPTTSGHSHRVAHLTVALAQAVNHVGVGRFRDTNFDLDALQEIEYASLLHDFGKLGVKENILVKAQKLYPDQMSLVLSRFELLKATYEIEYLKNLLSFSENPTRFPTGFSPSNFSLEYQTRLAELDAYLAFIVQCNKPTVLEKGGFEKLKDIANRVFTTPNGKVQNLLEGPELTALSVSRGSLTRAEFSEIQSHVTHTYEFLRKIPWGKKLSNVPQIAAKHHEKLDGSGYPTAAVAEDIPTQSRMMAIVDIFDALTASDRPYKRAVSTEKALDILSMDVRGGKLDKDLFDIFVESKQYESILMPNFQYVSFAEKFSK